MKKYLIYILFAGALCSLLSFHSPPGTSLQTGDIIFQSSQSGQSHAIQLATKSKFSHCGLIWIVKDKVMVLEAVGPVKITSLKDFVKHGDNNEYWVKRMKNRDSLLTSQLLKKMETVGESYLGKDYDIYFEWSDKNIYCSELVWKVYKQALGMEIGKLQKLKEFDLTSKAVKDIMKERYGTKIPYEETVISPVSIYNSERLMTVK